MISFSPGYHNVFLCIDATYSCKQAVPWCGNYHWYGDYCWCGYYYWRGDYDNAKGCLESANDSKGDPNVILYLGRTYEALGDKSYAASLYSSYLKDYPEDANICNQLGLCQLDNGEYAEALSAFQQGIAVPNNEIMQSLKYNEIVAYEYLSDFKQSGNIFS